MIIIASPAKTFKETNIKAISLPYFIEKSNFLIKKLQKFSKKDIINVFKVSDDLALSISNYYTNINNNYASIYLYNGAFYKNLDPLTINKDSLNRLYILSGLFGILNAFDGISPYRLDVADSFLGSLYSYWNDDINTFISTKLDTIIVNLSSKEYSRMLDLNNPSIFTIDFIDKNNKKNAMMLKKNRGLMARLILTLDINTIAEIKNLNIDNYYYDEELSTNNLLIFKEKN